MKFLITLSLLLVFSGAFAQKQQLVLASDIWPPFTDVKGEKALAIDLVDEALARSEVEGRFKISDFDSVLKSIAGGEADGSAALWKSDEREETLLFSNAYLENQLILVGRKGSDVEVSSFAELTGKRIGVVEDYAYGDALKGGSDNQLVYGESDQQNLERLLSHQVDFIVVDAILIQYLLKYQLNDVTELLEFGESPMLTKSLHLAIRKDIPGANDILEAFNSAIAEMIADGTYNKILELNWIRADVDGDGQLELILAGDKAGTSAPDNTYNIHYSERTAGSDRYYVDGKMYNSWDEVPDQYKVPLPAVGAQPNPNESSMKIKF